MHEEDEENELQSVYFEIEGGGALHVASKAEEEESSLPSMPQEELL